MRQLHDHSDDERFTQGGRAQEFGHGDGGLGLLGYLLYSHFLDVHFDLGRGTQLSQSWNGIRSYQCLSKLQKKKTIIQIVIKEKLVLYKKK